MHWLKTNRLKSFGIQCSCQQSTTEKAPAASGGPPPEVGPPARRNTHAWPGAEDGLSPATRAAYDKAWRSFVRWCDAAGVAATLPVPITRLVASIEALPPAIGRNGVKMRLAALAHAHRVAGHLWQDGHAAIRAALRRRQLDPAVLQRALDGCGEGLAGLRNRLVLLLCLAGGLSPEQVAMLCEEDVRIREPGLFLRIRALEAPEEEAGQTVVLSRRRDHVPCPVVAVERWLQQSGIRFGPVVQTVTVHGGLGGRITPEGVRRILRQIRARTELPEPAKPPVAGAWRGSRARKAAAAARAKQAGQAKRRTPSKRHRAPPQGRA